MKQIATFILIFACYLLQAQVTPSKVVRVSANNVAFGENLPRGTIITDATLGKTYVAFLGLASTKTIATCTIGSDIIELTNLYNPSVQSLSGTSVSWDCALGINATLTLSGTTTVTLSNVPIGSSGNIKVTNPAGAANSLTFALSGKTVKISAAVYYSAGRVVTSGSGYTDVYSWYYDGTNLIINGSLIYL